MKKFVKNYIGKGKQVEGLSIIKVNLKISDILKFAHKYNNEDYISLEIARLQTPDNFGNAYTVYVNRLEEEQIKDPKQVPVPTKSTLKTKSSKKNVPADLPF